jgi:antitoxin MazE
MITKAQRWGNSLAVRIPKSIADAAGITEHTELEVLHDQGCVLLRLREREPSLDELLAGITKANQHGEAGFGALMGNEAW